MAAESICISGIETNNNHSYLGKEKNTPRCKKKDIGGVSVVQ